MVANVNTADAIKAPVQQNDQHAWFDRFDVAKAMFVETGGKWEVGVRLDEAAAMRAEPIIQLAERLSDEALRAAFSGA